MSLCLQCNKHPQCSGLPYCGKTCERAAASARNVPAAAAGHAASSTPTGPIINPAKMCIECGVKPKYSGISYCGKWCVWAALVGGRLLSGDTAPDSAGNCLHCLVKPQTPGHQYCGRACANAAKRSRSQPLIGPSILKIVTPLRADVWEKTLTSLRLIDKFKEIPDQIRQGFPLGVSSPVTQTCVCTNARSARDNPKAIEEHIEKEVAEGRYSGPFTRSELESNIGPFRTTPLVAVAKDSPEKFRIVQDFNRSVNPKIDNDGVKFTFEWGHFADIAQIVRDAPQGTQAAIFDVEAAYRRIPLRPEDQPHAVITWSDKFWVDHAAAFGAISSGGNWGKVADCLIAIYRAKGIGPVKKWVDDFCFFRSLSPGRFGSRIYRYNESRIESIAEELGVPWKQSKTRPFSPTFTYLGFDWNIDAKTVGIPKDKCSEFIVTLRPWSDVKNTFTKGEAESLRGKLTHCCLALPSARTYLPTLTRFISEYKNHSEKRNPSAELKRDILFWINTLSSPERSRESIAPPPPPSPNKVYVDAASTWGIGVIVGDEWYNWRLTGNWEQDGRDIGWAEMVAVELGLRAAVSRGENNVTFSIFSDNTGVISAFDAGRARNPQQNRVLQRIVRMLMTSSANLTLTYVNTAENPADLPARGQSPRGDLKRRKFTFNMPRELKEFLVAQ